ncbi:pimeloyl-ACP methyl ester carboxylesterase [Arthrobacter nitrophenolicus]|uniref:Pimeloyl-ACP methyl ester carboxylesterase n=1 Tax=Arthrobacter nitrophenolicus TaxID=683150 RepID=A0ACC6TIW5_9MICC
MSAASIPGASTYATAPTRSITTRGVSYAYRELGPKGGVPVVFFVHLAGNLDNWDPQIIDAVAKEHHVVTFNNRGIGASTGVVPGSVEAMAEDAADFIRALGFEKVDIFGFSLGGMVAQALIGKHPDLVRKLVLAGTGPRGGKGMDKVARGHVLRRTAGRPVPGRSEGVPLLRPQRRRQAGGEGIHHPHPGAHHRT